MTNELDRDRGGREGGQPGHPLDARTNAELEQNKPETLHAFHQDSVRTKYVNNLRIILGYLQAAISACFCIRIPPCKNRMFLYKNSSV